MERGSRTRFGTIVKLMAVAGGLFVAARIYLALLPHSPALGAMIVVATGAALAFSLLQADRSLEELRSEAADPADSPPGG